MINTVCGQVNINDLGYILPHEHIFIDLTNEFSVPTDPEMAKICMEKLSLENYGYIRLNPYLMKDNFTLDDFDVLLEELKIFKARGGNTIIDCTNIGIKRDVKKLRDISLASGVNIICGSGYYTDDTFPEKINSLSEADIAKEIIDEIENGIDGTNIKPGIIGEIGTSKVITENEKKSLRGALLACIETGVPMQVHLHPWGTSGYEVVDILKSTNVDLKKVVICHTDVEINLEYMERLLDNGIYLEFDNIGKEFFIPEAGGYADGPFATDKERVFALIELCKKGYKDQLLIANDICIKQMLHKYGGFGFDHILRNIKAMMLFYGMPKEDVETILMDNPKNWLGN